MTEIGELSSKCGTAGSFLKENGVVMMEKSSHGLSDDTALLSSRSTANAVSIDLS
jgi:hypothetical protein